MANYPASLDTLTNPTSADNLASPPHASQHTDVNDIAEALEVKLGTGASVPTTVGHVLSVTSAGATAYRAQTIRLVGPYRVNWNSTNIGSDAYQIPGSSLPVGAFVVSAWKILVTPWVGGTTWQKFMIGVIAGGDPSPFLVTRYPVEADAQGAVGIVDYAGTGAIGRTIVVADATSVLTFEAYANPGPWTAGAFDIYALIVEPA